MFHIQSSDKMMKELSGKQSWLFTLIGFMLLIAIWWGLAEFLATDRVAYTAPRYDDPSLAHLNRDSLARIDSVSFANAKVTGKVYPNLPTPLQTVQAFPALINTPDREDNLIYSALHSIWLNLQGYLWAILIALPIGFAIGLIPIVRAMFNKPIDASRYLPLSALTGLFMLWFGLGDTMKVAFLAFGILVYMIPVVVQRINEVEAVHLQTVYSLGASTWQTIRKVYLPSVLSKFIDDLRVLTAISWTYIIIAEILNRKGGLGSLIYIKSRKSETDSVFAILIVIILIGLFQDRIFAYLDKSFFPHKHYKVRPNGVREVQMGILIILAVIALAVFLPLLTGLSPGLIQTPALLVAAAALVLVVLGEVKLRAAAS
jgi:NitT/TauT family transport system permease protein